MSNANVTVIQPKNLVTRVAEKYGVDPDKLLPALKSTAFKQRDNKEITNEQMMALLIVANQYGLNPFTKEIFAYPDKNGIVPVVSVDGWSRIINENPQMDGIEFEYSPEKVTFKGKVCHEWIDCIIYRKDRSRPTRAREFFSEVSRDMNYASPWDTHPNRMHRHKAEIQCARIAFGFAGIYDNDEAERILENAKAEPTSPPLGNVSTEAKAYFDTLITSSNALEMFVFTKTIDESTFTNLYHSFEKGQKGKYQRIVDDLVQKGFAQMRDLAEQISGFADDGLDVAIAEAINGMSADAIEHLIGLVEPRAASMIRQAQVQA